MNAPVDQMIWCAAFAAASNESSERTPEQCVDRADKAVERFRALGDSWRQLPSTTSPKEPSAHLSMTALRFIEDVIKHARDMPDLTPQIELRLVKSIIEAAYR